MILIKEHSKREAPSMTPSKYTADYFDSMNVSCIVTSNSLQGKHHNLKPCYGQRFFVMDEPAGNRNERVCFYCSFPEYDIKFYYIKLIKARSQTLLFCF